jgi:hypothetical protein
MLDDVFANLFEFHLWPHIAFALHLLIFLLLFIRDTETSVHLIVLICSFLSFREKVKLTEVSVSDKLEGFRAEKEVCCRFFGIYQRSKSHL